MTLVIDKIFTCLPFVERGKVVKISANPKGSHLLFTHKKMVVIRDINKTDNDIYYGHSSDVKVAKYSPSSSYIASGDASGKLRIWDATLPTHIMKNEFPMLGGCINDISWSDDNTRIAVGGEGRERYARVINAEMGTNLGDIIGVGQTVNAIDLKPTRPYRMALGSEDFSVAFYSGPPFKFERKHNDHNSFVNCLRYSPKGDFFVSGGFDGRMLVFDGLSGDRISEIGDPAHSGGIYAIDFSPSGNRLVSVSGDKTIKIWKAEDPNMSLICEYAFDNILDNILLGCVWTLDKIFAVCLSGELAVFDASGNFTSLSPPSFIRGHCRPIICATYSKTFDRLITASYDAKMVSWNPNNGVADVFKGPEAHTNKIQSITVVGNCIVSVGVDDRIVLSSMATNTYEHSTKLESQPLVASSAHDELLAVVCWKHVYLFSISTELSASLISMSTLQGEAVSGDLSSSGQLLAVGKSDKTIVLYSTDKGRKLIELPETAISITGEPSSIEFSPDGHYLATGDSERLVRIFKVNPDGEVPRLMILHELRSHAARITCLAWNPDNLHIASGGLDCAITVYSIRLGCKICEVRNAHPANHISALLWRSTNELISTGQDACVRLWHFK